MRDKLQLNLSQPATLCVPCSVSPFAKPQIEPCTLVSQFAYLATLYYAPPLVRGNGIGTHTTALGSAGGMALGEKLAMEAEEEIGMYLLRGACRQND